MACWTFIREMGNDMGPRDATLVQSRGRLIFRVRHIRAFWTALQVSAPNSVKKGDVAISYDKEKIRYNGRLAEK